MAIFPGEESSLCAELGITKNDGWETNKKLQEYLRENHSKRGGKFINDQFDKLGFPKPLIRTLNDLMRSHNLSINGLETELNKPYAAGQKSINLRQLACILCTADAIEFSDNRVIEGVLEKLKLEKGVDEIVSYHENMKHVCIGDSVAIGSNFRIIFNGTFDDPETLNLAYHTIDLIQEWVRGYLEIDMGAQQSRLIIKADIVESNIGILDKDFQRLSINLKKENIINLVASNSIWTNNKSLPIKELLQNSVEACRYRANNSTIAENYQPEIRLIFNRVQKTIQICDNGCGMSKHVILNNFLTIGNSRSFDSSYASNDFGSLSRFGIGFWSVFTIATIAKIETAPFELIRYKEVKEVFEGLEFEVKREPIHDYTIFNKKSRSIGTTILLFLKENIVPDEIFQGLTKEIICSDIPIIIEGIDEIISIPKRPQIPSLQDLFGAKFNFIKEQNIKLYEYSYESKDIKFILYFPYVIDNELSFSLSSGQRISDLFDIITRTKTEFSICGFKQTLHLPFLFFNPFLIGGYTIHTSDPKGFVYSLDRRMIIDSPRLTEVKQKLENLIWAGYIEFLSETNSLHPEKIYEFNTTSRRNGGSIASGINSGDVLINLNKSRYRFIIYKLYKIESGIEINKAKVIYKSLDEILKMNITIYTCQSYIMKYNFYRISTEEIFKHYHILSRNLIELDDCFYHEASLETAILFDNQPDSSILQIQIPDNFGGEIKIPYLKINPSKVNFSSRSNGYLGNVQGVWSGSIYIKEIIGNTQYSFAAQHTIVIPPRTALSMRIEKMYAEGQYYKLCSLISKLSQAENGFIDDEVKQYSYSVFILPWLNTCPPSHTLIKIYLRKHFYYLS